jgi:GH15 family glucan-1,4-alpha-glucosidase
MSQPISDYAIIGDTRTTALISAKGSIDWLCWPSHDSPALFTRLLDDEGGGHASITPNGTAKSGRRYIADTNILETSFQGSEGSATLLDFMPIDGLVPPPATGPDGDTQSRLIRILSCTAGEISGAFTVRVTPDYGLDSSIADLRCGRGHLRAGELDLWLDSSHQIVEGAQQLSAVFHLHAGERAYCVLSLDEGLPGPPIADIDDVLRRTQEYWQSWCEGICYHGDYREAIVRSALVLKLLTYAPTGGIVAAATTSLPEAVPGNRNFDYRYSWVRDASFTVTAFCNLGLVREAGEYMRFLRTADGSGARELKRLYAIDGSIPSERELDHLPGWRNIGPVRVGNAADGQQQHDIYGEFMIAIHAYLEAIDFDPPPAFGSGLPDLVRTLAGHAIRCRDDPDRGLWEVRSGPQHFQHSKAMLWVALDRAIKTADKFAGFDAAEVAAWQQAADDLRREYEDRTWNEAQSAYMQSYGSEVLDAAALRTVLFGALDPSSARVRSTLEAIDRTLVEGDLVYRYRMPDGFDGQEGTFTACAFWRVGVMALSGREDEARSLFERLLARGNDVGIYAEEIDPATGEQRGNVPQAFTHMCVINHAIRLEDAIRASAVATAHSLADQALEMPLAAAGPRAP